MRRHFDFNKRKNTTEFNERMKRVYKTVIWPKIERHEDDIYIHSRDGDRLDNLAFKFYNDVTLWWVIAQANHVGKGTLVVPPSMKIRIPSPERVLDIVDDLFDMERERL